MHPKALVVGLGLLATALVCGSAPQRIGDGREYVAMGRAMARLHAPALAPSDVAVGEAELQRMGFSGLALSTYPRLRDAGGRQDFFHFWFYSALAVPGLWLAALLGLHPNFGFVALNFALFFGSLWVVSRRVSWWVAAIVFCSPVLWWIDKAHTEVFTFSLLAAAFILLRDKPWWSMVAVGAAATQNVPIALLLPAILVLRARRPVGREPRFWLGAVAGVLLALLHPLYYEWRWRVPTPQVFQGSHARVPSLQELAAVIWDPNIGLLAHAPFFAAAVLIAAITLILRTRRRHLSPEEAPDHPTTRPPDDATTRPPDGNDDGSTSRSGADVWLALTAAGIFLASFSQTTNFNNGGTCGMSRYALWLIPLGLPFLDRGARVIGRPFRTALVTVALASCVSSVIAFQPRLPERYCTPTRLASAIWARRPSLDNPLPEIFAERLSGREPGLAPVATPGCTKVMVVGGYWPLPCVPKPMPPACAGREALCYANANGGGYEFVPVGAPVGYTLQFQGTWAATIEAATAMTSIVDRIAWRNLRRVTPTAPGTMRVEVSDVAWTEILEGPGELMVYARRSRPGACLWLQPSHAMDGWVLDAATGDELQHVSIVPSSRPAVVELGAHPAVVLVLAIRK